MAGVETATRGSSLHDEARTFLRHPNSRLLIAATATALTVRIALGGWRPADALVAAVILGVEPLTEWLIHVFLLHARPKTIAGRRVDLLAARKHRAHHADPRNVDLIFVPKQVLYGALPGALVLYGLLLRDLRLAATAVLVSYAMLTLYEWTHFLIHSRYLPKGRYYRYIWRAHRLHHYRNENYWFGVTIHLADHVLRTFPGREDVPLSPTARTLGVEPAPENVSAA
jgi:sterol desaturase/sphingolipid hydroxylase (fatty acid hydroxylase superfamily)